MTACDALELAAVAPRRRGYELTVVAPTFMERANVAGLAAQLRTTLSGVRWQVIFVDDASPDGTSDVVKRLAEADPRISCLRRVGRRGLAGAVMEGALASAAPYVLVMDADGQHDPSLIPSMLQVLRGARADVVVASRYARGGDAATALGAVRHAGSRVANAMARSLCRIELSDPMSGFFMARREVFDAAAGRVEPNGFKILFDLLATSRGRWRVEELPLAFRARAEGKSKLDRRVALDYLALLAARASRDVVSPRALMFALVGTLGVGVHLGALHLLLHRNGLGFGVADTAAALVAMGCNYLLNNELTYRDRRKSGWGLLAGLPRFVAICSVGLLINLAVALQLRQQLGDGRGAAAAGAGLASIWNYTVTNLLLW